MKIQICPVTDKGIVVDGKKTFSTDIDLLTHIHQSKESCGVVLCPKGMKKTEKILDSHNYSVIMRDKSGTFSLRFLCVKGTRSVEYLHFDEARFLSLHGKIYKTDPFNWDHSFGVCLNSSYAGHCEGAGLYIHSKFVGKMYELVGYYVGEFSYSGLDRFLTNPETILEKGPIERTSYHHEGPVVLLQTGEPNEVVWSS